MDQALQQRLKSVLKNDKLQAKLNEARKALEVLIKQCLQKPYPITSRIKDVDTLIQKIEQNDYDVGAWGITIDSSEKEIKNAVFGNIKDIIGIRVLCLYWDEEEIISSSLYDELSKCNALVTRLEKDEIKQNDGISNTIYKHHGFFDEYPFEVQIKCHLHNVWGEVDHKKVYKQKEYIGEQELIKNLVSQMHSSLRAVDSELKCIYESKKKYKDVLMELLYCLTHENVESACGSALAYDSYLAFQKLFFNDKIPNEPLERVLGHKLLKTENDKETIKLNTTHLTAKNLAHFKRLWADAQKRAVKSLFDELYNIDRGNNSSLVSCDDDAFVAYVLEILLKGSEEADSSKENLNWGEEETDNNNQDIQWESLFEIYGLRKKKNVEW